MLPSPQAVASKFLEKKAFVPPVKLPSGERVQINTELRRKGFDGRIRFQRPGQIVSAAFETLKRHGLTLAHVVNPHDFAREQGVLRLDLERINEQDPFSPTPIQNTLLYMQYTKLEPDLYEVIGYLS